ncbi:hypothetical protein AAFN86_16105 [Roseomonas sp. CAU 1739]|uniref:hypothetical protein n=1 Tax=Roseomonas sp. CAU 1739 TaxID=3140364 RepID=UPI00325A97E5
MESLATHTSSQQNGQGEVQAYWKACTAIREGETAIGVADLLTIAWTRSPILRQRVRQVLAKHGANFH